jgi:type III secretion protein S
MAPASILELTYQALILVLVASLPTVAAAAIVGLLVSILQAVTQIQDQSLPTAAKMIAVVLTIIMTAGWTAGAIYTFAQSLFKVIANI